VVTNLLLSSISWKTVGFLQTLIQMQMLVGAYMRSPFKYTLNVVCPITESLAGAHTYVTIVRPDLEDFRSQLWRNRYRNCYIWSNTRVYTTTDLGFGQFGSTCWGDSPATSAGARVRWFNNSNWWRWPMATPTLL
jgi:hypothetical protein